MEKKNEKITTSANDLYDVYNYHQHIHNYKSGFKITEGIFDVATYENCFWMLDLIIEERVGEPLETCTWELKRIEDNVFTLSCFNSNGAVIFQRENLRIVFYFDYLQILRKKKLLCLPIEKDFYD